MFVEEVVVILTFSIAFTASIENTPIKMIGNAPMLNLVSHAFIAGKINQNDVDNSGEIDDKIDGQLTDT